MRSVCVWCTAGKDVTTPVVFGVHATVCSPAEKKHNFGMFKLSLTGHAKVNHNLNISTVLQHLQCQFFYKENMSNEKLLIRFCVLTSRAA